MNENHQHFEWLQFGPYKSKDYGVWISGEGSFVVPERDVDVFEIPGRNGTLSIDNGRWKNIQITYPCFMSGNFLEDFAKFKEAFFRYTGYRNLWDTHHPDGYRKARIIGGLKPKPGPYNRSARFDITFDCWPQFYLDSGDTGITFTSPGTISNVPAESISRPRVSVYLATSGGSKRSGSVTIGGRTISFANLPYDEGSPLVIDCEEREITYGLNGSVSQYFTLDDGDFFEITPPSVSVSFASEVVGLSIRPRWWTL